MFVYVMENRSLPGLVKIGFSNDPDGRARELSTTGVPGCWRVFARFHSKDVRESEKAAHAALGDRRETKEFFRIDPTLAAERVAKAIAPWRLAEGSDDWERWADPARWSREKLEVERAEALRLARLEQIEAERRERGRAETERLREEGRKTTALAERVRKKRMPKVRDEIIVILFGSLLVGAMADSNVAWALVAVVAGFVSWGRWEHANTVSAQDIENLLTEERAEVLRHEAAADAKAAREEAAKIRWHRCGQRLRGFLDGFQ